MFLVKPRQFPPGKVLMLDVEGQHKGWLTIWFGDVHALQTREVIRTKPVPRNARSILSMTFLDMTAQIIPNRFAQYAKLYLGTCTALVLTEKNLWVGTPKPDFLHATLPNSAAESK